MKTTSTRVSVPGFMALLLGIAATAAQAGPGPLPPNSNAYGMGYDELSAAWMEWAFSIPATVNPFTDATGAYAAMGQASPVWFLAGNFGGPSTRSITVPSGTALFFPIMNSFWVNTPEHDPPDPPWSDAQEEFARSLLRAQVDTFQNLVLTIDGRSIPRLERFRVESVVGSCVLPEDSVFTLFGYDDLLPGPHECVADGYWALLPPLSVGKHTIRFGGEASDGSFGLDVTFNVTVRPRQKVIGSSSSHP